MRLDLSRDADADLDDILTYGVQTFGLSIGRDYYFSFDSAFAFLRENPRAGQVDEETGLGLRRWHHRKHRIFYRVGKEAILVVRILHHARDLDEADF